MSSSAADGLRAPYEVPAGSFDEAVGPDGLLREPWATVTRAFGPILPGELAERQRRIDRLLDAEGSGHLVHELTINGARSSSGDTASLPWRLDPIPIVIAAAEFDVLAAATVQRMRALEAMLRDLYGRRELIRSGTLPASVLFSLDGMRTSAERPAQARWLVHYALDVVRTASGEWRVVQDFTDAPPGLGYAVINRAVMARVTAHALRASNVAPIASAPTTLRLALAGHAGSATSSPRTVVLTAGTSHPTYVEHSFLALQMGVHLAEGGDLVVRQNRLWLRALEALEPIDVVYRRVEDMTLDPLEINSRGRSGVPALTWAAQSGGVALANGFGASVAEEQRLAPYIPAVATALLGETLAMQQLVDGQPLATTPSYSSSGTAALQPSSVVVRLHAIAAPDGISVVTGGVARVVAPGEEPAESATRLVKDIWVIGGARQQRLALRIAPPPQVDFRTSVTKRAAESLYWMGRSAERAEVGARAVRLLGQQVDQDPALTLFTDAGGWSAGALALLRAARSLVPSNATDPDALPAPLAEQFARELGATQTTVASSLGAVVHQATSVRDYMSLTMGRLLGRLAELREHLLSPSPAGDDLEQVLVDLAALAGFAMESTVRGPSWRFLDIGRRLERAFAVLASVEAAIGVACDPLVFQPLAESVLSINESLVAYRRRYRSDVDLTAIVDLLVHDDSNPRGLAFQLDRLREHMASLGWQEGSELVDRAMLGALTPIDGAVAGGRRLSIDALVLAARAPLLSLSSGIAARWFAVPVNPMVVGAR
jgi:uncharacterized circularly permuted ATP-grasp superfamily protein/uncharacterized alpha-E superfamily protein